MTWILGGLLALLVLDAVRMRARIDALAVLPDDDAAVAGATPALHATDPPTTYRVIAAPGVTVADATVRAGTAFARAHRLDVVDLVPADLPALRAMGVAQIIDAAQLRGNRLAVGRSAGHALLVASDVAARAAIEDPADEVALVRLAVRLKTYASASFDVAIAPAEHAVPENLARRRAVLGAILGSSAPLALAVTPVFLALLGLGVWLRPVLGAVAIAIWHLQPVLVLAGTKLRARAVLSSALLRAPLELWLFARTLVGGWRPPAAPDRITALRPVYDRLATTTTRFWEPRRDTCPMCSGREVVTQLRTSDLIQHKPGRFTLERCRACGHIFQNPRLSSAGLDYYYKDFYDGLGEENMEQMFGVGVDAYRDRARMVKAVAEPARWLDVGAGHGHFCCVAQGELPTTRFDGLDLGASIEEASRRRWVETSYRGLFPELAPTLAGRYDALSMSHYLEHTVDPRKELEAAHIALAPGGYFMIEVPDPEYRIGRMLGRWWLPWLQPQHQHLFSTANLDKLLREHGFEPLEWHTGRAHQPIDFVFAVYLMLSWIAPPADVPWRRSSALRRGWRAAVYVTGGPFLLLGWLLDKALAPIIARRAHSNTYRVLARRDGAA